ncbi:MAG: zf-TFIIB domain-containing protein [Verrucomicrobiae bacterium]|nr:zf-TFIIB domain-containing protein [Verrucomicrobiae bacterium]
MPDAACPVCDAHPELLRQQGEHESFRCVRCGGFWVPAVTLAALTRRADEFRLPPDQADAVLRRPAAPGPARYRPCPVCRELMNRNNYARVSGVVVDECRAHGTWFDCDELNRVLDFVRAGGLDRSRAREWDELRERERRARRAGPTPERREWYDPASPAGTWDWELDAAVTLVRDSLD